MSNQEPLDNQEISLEENDVYVNPNEEDIIEDTVTEPEAEESAAPAEEEAEQTTEPEADIPEKYRGKSIAEIVHMHQEAEKLVGRQGAEVGELRNIVDNFIKAKSEEAVEVQDTTPEIDFYDNPQEAVQQAISGSEEMKAVKEMLAAQKQAEVISKIEASHPDYESVIQDPDFGEWIKASSVRLELLQRADAYDFDAANFLLNNWKERQEVVEKAKEVNELDRKQQLKAASTGGGKGSGEPATRKIYKRSDIINLMRTNPEKYAAMAEDLTRAYAEGRVK